MAIYFFSENIEMPSIDRKQIKIWVKEVGLVHSKYLGEINYIFTSEENILKVNQDYLQHDYYTDVITFDYSEGRKISGDIYISTKTIKTNAQKYNQDYTTELNRVIIHGVLHLIGFKDKMLEEEQEMRIQENKALILLQKS